VCILLLAAKIVIVEQGVKIILSRTFKLYVKASQCQQFVIEVLYKSNYIWNSSPMATVGYH
jgi:hypothetical protein